MAWIPTQRFSSAGVPPAVERASRPLPVQQDAAVVISDPKHKTQHHLML